jgi:hypothetical protein
MLRMLQNFSLYFQSLSLSVGDSMQHGRDMDALFSWMVTEVETAMDFHFGRQADSNPAAPLS